MLILYNIALYYEKNKSRKKAFVLVVIKNGKYLDLTCLMHDFYFSTNTQRWKLKTVFEILCYFGINIILLDRLLPSRSRSKSFLFEVDSTSYILSWFFMSCWFHTNLLRLFAVVHNEFCTKVLIFRFRLFLSEEHLPNRLLQE